MNPNDQYNPDQQSNQPPVYGPQPSSNPIGPTQPFVSPKPAKSKRTLITIVAAGVLLLLIITVVVVLAAGKKTPKTAKKTTETTQSQGPQAASAIDVEQTNNAISQDVGGLNTDQDFPPTQLDDKSLKL